MEKTITVKDNIQASEAIEDIVKRHNIDLNLYYVDSIRIREGSWNTAAKKRDQDLVWESETQNTETKNKDGNVTSTKSKSPVQIMTGHGKHYPEFMLATNKTYTIEIVFKRKPIESDILESYKELIKELPSVSLPVIRKRRSIFQNGVAAEMAIYDAHFGKLAWKDETGYRHYDTKLASKDYMYVTDSCLDLASPHKPEKIFYILGQDMYHVDNMASHTTGGDHTLDVDGRITKVHKIVFLNSKDAIIKARTLAPVEVVWIPGNHDYLASFMLVFALQQYFKDDSRVTFDVSENPRKARLWGNLLVGWTHRIVGKHTVWSNELAQAFPELWGKSVFREWHHGDQHKKQNVKVTPLATSGGVICRQITALSPVDQWHTSNVYTDAVPGGELFLWSKDKGVFANYIAWTGQYESHRNKIINNK